GDSLPLSMRESSSDTGSGSKRQQCTKNSQNNHDRTAKLTNSTGTMTYCCGENPNKRHNYGDHAFEDSFLISRNCPSSDSDSRPPPQHRRVAHPCARFWRRVGESVRWSCGLYMFSVGTMPIRSLCCASQQNCPCLRHSQQQSRHKEGNQSKQENDTQDSRPKRPVPQMLSEGYRLVLRQINAVSAVNCFEGFGLSCCLFF